METAEPGTRTAKEELRKAMRARLAAIDPELRLREGREVTRLLLESRIWRGASTILSFLPMRSEIDTGELNRAALAAGKLLALPRVEGDRLVFHRVAHAEGPWIRGSLGALEPEAALPLLADAVPPLLVLVPGLAFDRTGRRLGRGRGFYDRFLASLAATAPKAEAPRTVGLCFTFQLVGEVPTDPGDAPVDMVVTADSGPPA